MANLNKVQVTIRTPSGAIERRNYFVAAGSLGRADSFDDSDIRPVTAWQPLPLDAVVEPYRHTKRRGWGFGG
ncbi:hypothetical protein [Paraburkholderia youngii]|uniref:hypothetical protein n=1 Tax=Paraburkholderia youngii TaxID=2782701 RepID=UPI003D225324